MSELLALATSIAHEAGAGLREAFGRSLAISAKSTPTAPTSPNIPATVAPMP